MQTQIEKKLERLVCPISQEIMFKPVTASDGKTYEEEAIQEHFDKVRKKATFVEPDLKNPTISSPAPVKILSPITGLEMTDLTLRENDFALSMIKEFLEENPSYGAQVYFSKRLVSEALAAVTNKDVKTLERLIEKDKRLLEKVIKEGKTLIDVVCQEGTPELLVAVLKAFRKNNLPDCSPEKAKELLLVCVASMQKAGVKSFIETSGWSTDQCEAFFKTQVLENCVQLVESFIEYDFASIDKSLDEKNNTALHLAVLNGHSETVKRLIALGADSKLPNKDDLDAKQLAEKIGNRKLARDISQWRHDKKSEETFRRVAQLEAENILLKQKLLAAETRLIHLEGSQNKKADKESLALMSGRFFSAYVRKPFLDVAQQKKQDDFVEAILSGDLDKVKLLHQQGGLIDRCNSEGMPPLVAAVYSGFPDVFYYIEQLIKDPLELREYFSMIDLGRVQDVVKKLIPEVRPQNATYAWIGEWYEKNEGKVWCKKYDQVFPQFSQDSPDWRTRKNIWFNEGCIARKERSEPRSIKLTLEGVLNPNGSWTQATSGHRKGAYTIVHRFQEKFQDAIYSQRELFAVVGYRESTRWAERHETINSSWGVSYLPDPLAHDQFVAQLIQDLNNFEKDITEKLAESKQHQKVIGF